MKEVVSLSQVNIYNTNFFQQKINEYNPICSSFSHGLKKIILAFPDR